MELEMLIELGVKNEKLFNVVIEDMIRRNKPDCGEGINLFKIMRDNKWEVNTYLLHPQFDKYKDLLKTIKDSHSKFKIDL